MFRCYHEHVDLFTEIESPEKQPLIETPFGGRYCGQNIPRYENFNRLLFFYYICLSFATIFSFFVEFFSLLEFNKTKKLVVRESFSRFFFQNL